MNFLQKHKNKLITIAIIIAALIAGGYYSLSKVQESKDQLVDLKRVTVEKHDIQKIISASGKIVAKTSRNIFAPISGQVKELKVEENQKVEVDEVLAILEATDARGQTYDYEMKSSITGTVTKISVQMSQPVMPGQTVMFTVSDLEDLEIMSMLSETDVTKINDLQKVMIEIPALEGTEIATSDLSDSELHPPYGGQVEGEVVFISLSPAELNATTSNYKVTINLKESPEDLRLGMSVDLEFIVEEKENVVAVSDIYIFSEDGKDFVKVYKNVNDNIEILETEVELGIEGEALVEIISGIDEGDEIVLPTENIPVTELRMPFMDNLSGDE